VQALTDGLQIVPFHDLLRNALNKYDKLQRSYRKKQINHIQTIKLCHRMQVHPLENFFGKIWAKFGEIWAKFGQIWLKVIKIWAILIKFG